MFVSVLNFCFEMHQNINGGSERFVIAFSLSHWLIDSISLRNIMKVKKI